MPSYCTFTGNRTCKKECGSACAASQAVTDLASELFSRIEALRLPDTGRIPGKARKDTVREFLNKSVVGKANELGVNAEVYAQSVFMEYWKMVAQFGSGPEEPN